VPVGEDLKAGFHSFQAVTYPASADAATVYGLAK
jgi:hypothetical protein